jgi:predicted transcriptional regulator with HTH domain
MILAYAGLASSKTKKMLKGIANKYSGENSLVLHLVIFYEIRNFVLEFFFNFRALV